MPSYALRRLAEARGGTAAAARKAGVERQNVRRVPYGRGKLPFVTLAAVTKAVGLRLTVKPA